MGSFDCVVEFWALANMVLTGVTGAWFGRLLSRSRVGGFIAGTLLEGSAVMAFFIHVGVGELHHLWWLPLGLGCQLMARKTQEWKWFIAVSGCLIGAMLSCFYLGFFLALSVLTWAILTGWKGRKTPKLVLQYVLAASLAIAIVIPVTKSFASSYKTGSVPEVGLMDTSPKIMGNLLPTHQQPDWRRGSSFHHSVKPKVLRTPPTVVVGI